MGDTPKKTSESNSKCFICSSIPTSKNKVYLFEKTSTDLAGIIRSLVEFDVKKKILQGHQFACLTLIKFHRAEKKL